jgi:NitT/TauT family transport system substrate-binding protein
MCHADRNRERVVVRLAPALAAVAAGTVLLTTNGCATGTASADRDPATSSEKVTYVTGQGQSGSEAYVYVGIDKGYFRDIGIDVAVKPGSGTGDNLTLLTGGNADFTPVDLTSMMIQIGGGKVRDVTAVAAIHQRTPVCIMALAGQGIAAPKDLEGRTVGDPSGSTVGLLFRTYAQRAGVDASKVRFVNVAAPQLPRSLAAGAVDAIGQVAEAAPVVEKAAGKTPVLLPYSEYLADMYGNVLVTSTKLAQQKPDLVRKFTTALLNSLRYAVDNPTEAGQILHSHVPAQDARIAAAELRLMKRYVDSGSGTQLGALEQRRIASDIALLEAADALPTGLTPDRLVDFSLAPR